MKLQFLTTTSGQQLTNYKMKTAEIKNKILQGSKLALRKLVDKKKKENSYLLVSDHGKVVKIQASDINI